MEIVSSVCCSELTCSCSYKFSSASAQNLLYCVCFQAASASSEAYLLCSGLPMLFLLCSLDVSPKRVALCEHNSGMYGFSHWSFAVYFSASCTITHSLFNLNCHFLVGVHVRTILSPCLACLHAAMKACLRNATTSYCIDRRAFCTSQIHVSTCAYVVDSLQRIKIPRNHQLCFWPSYSVFCLYWLLDGGWFCVSE